jgi:hypothetical protein
MVCMKCLCSCGGMRGCYWAGEYAGVWIYIDATIIKGRKGETIVELGLCSCSGWMKNEDIR